MFGSKIRYFTKAFLSTSNKIFSRKQIHKLAIATGALLIWPGYVYAADQYVNQQTHVSELTEQQRTHEQHNHKENNDKNEKDQLINFISDYDDAKNHNLQGHILIWYESTGEKYIDDEVLAMLKKFGEEKKNSMSCPFKIVIDTTPRSKIMDDNSNYYKKDVQIVIVKPNDLKIIPISKYLSFNGVKDLKYSTLFQRITTQINEFNQINKTNVKDFMEALGNKSYEATVVMCAPKNAIKFRKARKKFHAFIQSKQAFIPHLNKAIITDEKAMKELGLPDIHPESDNIYIIVPQSENIVKEGQPVTINNNTYHIYTPWNISRSVVFSPYLEKSSPESFTLRVTVDLSQNIAEQLSQFYGILAESQNYPQLSSMPKFLTFSSAQKNAKPIQIVLERNNFNSIVNVYSPNCRYSNQQKHELLFEGHRWKFSEEQISASQLENWIQDVLNHKVEPTFESEQKQESKVKAYNSTRITGQQYPQVLNKNKKKPKIVFHFSQHCHSCNKFKHIYEEIAGERSQQFDFYRIDNDFNKSKGLKNFNSTPIFVFYKDKIPYFFKNTIFTKALFESFLDITNGLHKIDQSVLDQAVKERMENEVKLSDFV